MTFFKQLPNIQTSDPDEARRGKLLNTLLVGIAAAAILGLIYTSLSFTFKWGPAQENNWLFLSSLSFLVVSAIIYFINQRSVSVAASIFLSMFTIALAFSDTPKEVANGRSLFAFAIPITIASLLLRPASSFIFATITGGLISWLSFSNNIIPNFPAIIGFFVLAFVSWLSSRSLEQALRELRTINADLDKIAKERTQALAESLTRERIEAGRNQAILEGIADGVAVFDNRHILVQTNPAIVQLLEMPNEKLIGATIEDFARSEHLDAKNRGILAGLLTKPGQQLTSQRIIWDKKTLSVSSAQVHDAEGNLLGTVAVFRDFTREAQVEKMKSTFLAIVSHELRTPLNAILGYAEMLKEAIYGPINEKQASVSVRIMTNTQRLLSIVSDLLDQSQIEAGKLTIQMRPFRPAELLENVHAVMDKIAASKGVILASEIAPRLPEEINGDPARLQQILVNLVNNAVKFTDQGTVNVRLFRPKENYWGMEVLDNGQGITEEELPHIFDAFRQAESAIIREHGGFGLGLSIVKNLVDLMGGTITVKSKVGVGSTFTITLPLVPVSQEDKSK